MLTDFTQLGGCSALNYMAYQHAPIGALQKWADAVDDPSFTYDSVSKYYRKSLNFTPPDQAVRIANATPNYDVSTLSTGGLLDVTYANYAQALGTWVAKGMEAVGIRPNRGGFTGGNLMGSSYLLSTINHTTGFRESSETAFLQPALGRSNLVLFDHTLAEQIVFRGNVATGVRVSSGNGTFVIEARKEVILSAGVFQSPQLLLVSGVGPRALLRRHNITVVADRPGVGQNLQDHVFFGIAYRVNVVTSSHLAYGNNLQIAIDEFNNHQRGFLSSPGGDFGGYEKIPQDLRTSFSRSTLRGTSAISPPALFKIFFVNQKHDFKANTKGNKSDLASLPNDWPEMQYLTLPAFVGDFQTASVGSPPDGYQYGTLLATINAPFSRGTVSIMSASTRDPPLINPGWLTSQTDVELAVAGFKRLRQIFETPVLRANLTIGPEYFPGANVSTNAQIHENIKRTFNTMYHASATCKMGRPTDKMAVVDTKARVYGVKNREYRALQHDHGPSRRVYVFSYPV